MSNLPKGWEKVFLKEVVQDMHQGINTVTENIEYYDNGIDILQAKHITSGYIDLSDPKKVSIEDYNKYKAKYQPQINHILLTNIGTIGKVLIVEENIDFLIAWNIFLIKSNQLKINPHFLFYVLKKYDIDKFYDKFLTGNATKFINKKFMGDIEIPLPPLEEQKKIADILSTVDKKIAFVEENINATEELKKGLMQKLLTEGIGHTEFKDSELGRIPESWEVIPFIELADKNIKHSFTGGPFGSDLKSEHYTDIGVRVIQLQNIGDGYFINNDFVYVSEEKAELLKSCQIYPNDIILAKMAEPVARACLIPDFESKYVMCSDGIRLKVDNSKFNTEFIFYSINYDNFRKIAVARSNGTTRLRIGLSALKSIPILIPPLEEQKQIAEILSTVDKKLENLKEKKQSFEELKKGLMQKLLTGEVRV